MFLYIDNLLFPLFTTARSIFPSPLASPVEMPQGVVPTVKFELAVVGILMVPVVEKVLRNNDTMVEELLETAISRLLSSSKSAKTTPKGATKPVSLPQVVKLREAKVELFLSIVTVLLALLLAITISGLPSLSKSPMAMPNGRVSVV